MPTGCSGLLLELYGFLRRSELKITQVVLRWQIPGPSVASQDTSFLNKSNVPIDEPENIEENSKNRPRKSTNAPKPQTYNNKENEELLKKLGILQMTSPKINTADKQIPQQKNTKPKDASNSQPKTQIDDSSRSKTPKSTQTALKQILSRTYYGTNKGVSPAQFKKKDNVSVTNMQNPTLNKSNLNSDSRAKPLNESVQSGGSGFFIKKSEVNISKLSLNSPLAFEFNQTAGISSTGNASQTFNTSRNRDTYDEQVGDQHQRPMKLSTPNSNRLNFGHKRDHSLKLNAKTPTTEKDRSCLADKTNLMHEEGKTHSRTASTEKSSELRIRKERQHEELVKKYEQVQMEECTFQPVINPSSRPRRSMEDFVTDQMNYEAAKQYKTEKLKEQIQNEILEAERVVPPELAVKSREMVERKRRKEGDDRTPYDRLYERSKSPNMTQNDGSGLRSSGIDQKNQSSECTFHPKIRSRSQNLKREDPVGEILYRDALRRHTKSTENVKLLSKAFENKPHFVNESSKKMLAHKLIKEFEAKTDDFFEQTQEHKFNYLHMCEFLNL